MAKTTNSNNSGNARKQTFAFTAPDALRVLLAGDFTQWQTKAIPMKKDAEGMWKTTVTLPRGSHRYRFLVDGQWRDDPECASRVSNPYGGHEAVRQVT
jgi:1,4-alpha-glucan branching enzyme